MGSQSRPERTPIATEVAFSTDIFGIFGPLFALLPLPEQVRARFELSLLTKYYPSEFDPALQHFEENPSGALGDLPIERLYWFIPDSFPDDTQLMKAARILHGRLGPPSGKLYDWLITPSIRAAQLKDLIVHVGEAQNLSRQPKIDTQHTLWVENDTVEGYGWSNAIKTAKELQKKGYKTGVVIDLAHLIREALKTGHQPIPNTRTAIETMFNRLAQVIVKLRTEALRFRLHLPIGTNLSDSIPPIFWEDERYPDRLYALLSACTPEGITIENQGPISSMSIGSHVTATHRRIKLLRDAGILQQFPASSSLKQAEESSLSLSS